MNRIVLKLIALLSLLTLSSIWAKESLTQEKLLEWYKKIESANPQEKSGLSVSQQNMLFEHVSNHPVANLEAETLSKYDPTGDIGFCFGRAMTVTLLARKMDLKSTSISKLFVLGDMQGQDGSRWRFHVTTLIKGLGSAKKNKDGWVAIDPIMGQPLSASQWIMNVRQGWEYDPSAPLKFYHVTYDSVLPDIHLVPDTAAEKGERIIELSFNPTSFKKSFVSGSFPLWKEATNFQFKVSRNAENKHFIAALEQNEPFDFFELTVNESKYDYGHYFEDLLETEMKNPSELLGQTRGFGERHLSVPIHKPLGFKVR